MSGTSDYIDNEWYVVRHSGELPEVAYHSSLHYLTEAEDGPRLTLADHHLQELRQAALSRYCDIILRDLSAENRHTTMYRGVRRAIINYQRLRRFCSRQHLCPDAGLSRMLADKLAELLKAELVDTKNGESGTINCSYEELRCFSVEIGLDTDSLLPELKDICAPSDPSGAVAII